jgi:DNA mismatch repair ATPase MutS
MEKFRAFAEFETFYALFRPLTPRGRRYREARPFFTDAAVLKTEYDLAAAMGAFMAASRHKADKLRFHLRNIPPLELNPEALGSAPGLFLARKFLANTQEIFKLLPAPLRAKFGARWTSAELLALLNKGGAGEAFHIADAYSPDLAAERAAIAACDKTLKGLRDKRLKTLRETRGLDFSDRDFLVIEEAEAARLGSAPELFVEPFDGTHVTVKPVYGQDYMEAAAERDRLRAREQELEAAVVKRLAAAAVAEKKEFEACLAALERIDVAAERARLAGELKLTRPVLRKFHSPLKLQKARFLPLEARLAEAGLKYTPLTATFGRRVNIIYGSNMGGKTVALKTLAFMQLLAQSGFFTPAEAFETCLFDGGAFIGGAEMETAGGLSSFGLEMNDFALAHARLKGERLLLVMDEFARTTNSEEAAALLGAILEDLAARPGACAFLATHFSGLRAGKAPASFKMRGFDTAAFNTYFSGKPACGLDEKLRMINKFMRYELLEGGEGGEARDAIKIAGILGVARAIVRRAQEFMEEKK